MGKLGLFIEEITEKTTKNNQYEVLTSSQNGIISQEEYFNKQIASVDNIGYKIIRRGQFTYRSMSDTGRFYINRLINKEVGIVSPAYPVFKLVGNKLDPEYLELFFQSEAFQRQISDKSSGSTRLALRFSKLENVEIDVPSIEIQRKIVDTVKRLKATINTEDNELVLCDELIKSRFNEMFSAFPKVELSQISQIIMGQSPESTAYNDDGIGLPFFQGKADYGEKYTIVKHYTKKWNKEAKRGYVLMSVRAPVGPVNIASTDCAIGRGLCAMNAKPNKANNEFLYNALNSMQQEIVLSGKDGSTFAAINKDQVYKLLLPQAPIELQNDFSEFVHRVDKLKFNVQKRIEKYKELLNKKMDEYFN